jgi:hypothetical protein
MADLVEGMADTAVLGPYNWAKKAIKAMAGQNDETDDLAGSSSNGGMVAAGVSFAITPLISLTAFILLIVFGVKLTKLVAERGVLGSEGKHLVSLGIATPALLFVPYVNLGMAIWFSITVNNATKAVTESV